MRSFTNLLLALPLIGQALANVSKDDAQRALNADHMRNRGFPSWQESAVLARRMLAQSKFGVFSTVYPHHSKSKATKDLGGVAVGLPEYYADCASVDDDLVGVLGDGNPLVLGLNLGTSFRNIKEGSNLTITIDWWKYMVTKGGDDDDEGQEIDPKAHIEAFNAGELDIDDLLEKSPANMPRMSLIGYLDRLPDISDDIREKFETCFVGAHPDSVTWLPNHDDAAHRGFWARLVVQKILWIGGFGDRARIGWLNIDDWHNVRKADWEAVRLPGEN